MKKISLRQALKIIGAKNIELHKGFYYQSGFYELNDQLYYIATSDDRFYKPNGELHIYYRTAKHRKDYTGGTNRHDFNQKLNSLGYSVCISPKYKGNSL